MWGTIDYAMCNQLVDQVVATTDSLLRSGICSFFNVTLIKSSNYHCGPSLDNNGPYFFRLIGSVDKCECQLVLYTKWCTAFCPESLIAVLWKLICIFHHSVVNIMEALTTFR